MRVLVTGGSGFVGRHLCKILVAAGCDVVATTRSNDPDSSGDHCKWVSIADIGSDIEWAPILEGIDYVVHMAARVHVMREIEENPQDAFRRVNVAGTERLLRAAGTKSIKRFVFVSTVKVHGDATVHDPYRASDALLPTDPYGQSKAEAEHLVVQIGSELGFETTIIRPTLVYGPGVGGNFIRLLRMVDKGIPLPFGLVDNSRSFVGVDNLCSLICECLTNQSAAGKRLLVSDNNDVSTKELINFMATSMSKQARLIPVPPSLLRVMAKLVGKSNEATRLLGSLQVDISDTMRTLNWKPPVSLEEGVQSTVRWYQQRSRDE